MVVILVETPNGFPVGMSSGVQVVDPWMIRSAHWILAQLPGRWCSVKLLLRSS